MLEGVALQVSVDSDGVFVLDTSSAGNANACQRRYSFDGLRRLKKRLLAAMQHGHLCHAECPWIYSFLKNYFPKKATLALSASKRSAKRRDAVELCLTNMLQFVCDRKNHSCAVVFRDLAQELACALFGYDLRECSVQLLTPVDVFEATTRSSSLSFSSLSSLSSSLSESDEDELSVCNVCRELLHQRRDGDSFTSTSDNSNTSDKPEHERDFEDAQYTTTLGCGHCFHDECAVSVLNDTQRCPTCGHREIS
ncbi:hypothetical protein PybrP1_000471 [[Pythium] brassicae (nom. inval.)]|nr:hypothetical protein PybrP1_000471 [[Pythium] brassicae (nom. inval.)]